MEEAKLYLDKALENLDSSRILYNAGKYRNSVSLSYYSMFLAAKSLLILKGFSPKTHKGLISLFSKEYIKTEKFSKDLYGYLAEAQTMREDADYTFELIYTKDDAWNLIKQAELFISESKKFF